MAKPKAIKPGANPKEGEYSEGPVGQLELPRSIHLVGPQGQGKSTVAATACDIPGVKTVRIVDFDSGASGFSARYPQIQETRFAHGDIATFDKWFKQYLKDDCRDDDVCIFDTVTKAQRWKRKKTVFNGSPNTQQQWGEVMDWTIDLAESAQHMRALGILTFHTQESNTIKGTDDAELRRFIPALQGAAAYQVGASADIVAFCNIEELDEDDEDYTDDSPLEYQMILQPTDSTLTKNRFNLPPVINAAGGLPRVYELIAERNGTKKGKKK